MRWFGVVGGGLPDARASLWRALAVYRVLVLGYAVVVVLGRWRGYAHPLLGWVLVAGMVLWTAVSTRAYSRGRGSLLILVADVAVACGAVVLTVLVETPEHVAAGAPTLPTLWASASILAWAVSLGVRGGTVAAAAVSSANLIIRPHPTADSLANVFLLFLAGIVVGHVSTLVLAAEAERTRTAESAAATAERERLARGIHDSVLQALALVQRRGREIGGEAAELGRLAGEQERMLRALVASEATGTGGAAARASVETGRDTGATDLGLLLRTAVARRPYATFAGPAPPVVLPGYEASEMAAAAVEALENVRRHASDGARAWVLVEDEPAQITVTVRDDGAGMPEGRLTAASAEGRLGVAQSIVARMRTLGGDASITSAPGQGTEVELRLPKKPAGGEGRR